jgi:hypothetical protein
MRSRTHGKSINESTHIHMMCIKIIKPNLSIKKKEKEKKKHIIHIVGSSSTILTTYGKNSSD